MVEEDHFMVELTSGKINLFEAEQLARLTHSRTGIPEEKMKRRRGNLLRTHDQLKESGARLKARVDALLYSYKHPEAMFQPETEAPEYSPEILAEAERLEAEIRGIHEGSDDSTAGIGPDHFFYEYQQLITSYVADIRPDEMSDAELDRLMALAEPFIHHLYIIHKRQNPPADEKTMFELTDPPKIASDGSSKDREPAQGQRPTVETNPKGHAIYRFPM